MPVPPHRRLAAIPPLVVAAIGASAPAGDTILVPSTVFHGGAAELFAKHVRGVGDVNADGFDDVVVHGHDDAAGSDVAHVYSGADGTEIGVIDGFRAHPFLGMPIAPAGDVDADGHADILVGDQVGSRAIVYSGATLAPLFTFPGDDPLDGFGGAVGAAGDVNGDGRPDVVVGTVPTSGGGAGYARVFSGADGSVLHSVVGEASMLFGGTVDGAGDVDDDGVADFAVGAMNDGNPVYNPGIPPFIPPFWTDDDAGVVRIYSGADGSELRVIHGDVEYGLLAFSLRAAGDVDGDGRADVVAGTGYQDAGTVAAYARVLSGADGAALFTFPLDSAWPIDVAPLGDLDGDGRADVVMTTLDQQPGAPDVLVRSGSDGAPLFAFDVAAYGAPMGPVTADGAGDVDGDGRPDLIVGVAQAAYGAGVAQLFVSRPATIADLDGSGTVDFADLLVVLAAWGDCSGDCPADLNGDGAVGLAELLVVLQAWT